MFARLARAGRSRGARPEVVESEQADYRRQIAVPAVAADLSDQLAQRHLAGNGDFLHAVT